MKLIKTENNWTPLYSIHFLLLIFSETTFCSASTKNYVRSGVTRIWNKCVCIDSCNIETSTYLAKAVLFDWSYSWFGFLTFLYERKCSRSVVCETYFSLKHVIIFIRKKNRLTLKQFVNNFKSVVRVTNVSNFNFLFVLLFHCYLYPVNHDFINIQLNTLSVSSTDTM